MTGRAPNALRARREPRTWPVLMARALAFAQGLSINWPSLRKAIGVRLAKRAARNVCRI